MRIAFLLYGNLNLLTGGFLYDRCLVDYLETNGEELDVMNLPWKSVITGLLDNIFLNAESALKNRDYDLVLEDALASPSLLRFNTCIRNRWRLPVVSILHSLRSNETRPAWESKIVMKMEAAYFRSLDGLIFNSHTTRGEAESRAGRKLHGVVAYPGRDRLGSGLTDDEITERALKPGPLEILFAGSLTRHKGLHFLLDALDRLSQKDCEDWRLNIAGNEGLEPAYARSVRSRIAQSGWSEKAKLLGSLRGFDLVDCFLRSHVLAVPSAHEGFGMVYMEGMGFGLPGIASSLGAAREVIRSGENGFLVDPGDSRVLADRIASLITDRRLLKEMSLNALRTHAAHPTWKESMALVHSFLKTFDRNADHRTLWS
jgi:glycosyltransferase involved in cell wall biosynthesis